MNGWYPYLSYLINLIYGGFALMAPLLLVLRVFWKAKANLWNHLLHSSNILLLIASTLYTPYYLISLTDLFYLSQENTQVFRWSALGPYWYTYWIMLMGRTLFPQILWFRKYRESYTIALLLAFFVASGAILERLVIFFTTLYRDYLPSSWTYYTPGVIELLFMLLCYTPLVILVSLFIRKKTIKSTAPEVQS